MGIPNSKEQQQRQMFLEALRQRPLSIDRIRALVQENPELVKIRDNGNLPLERLLWTENLDLIKCLVQAWPKSLRQRNPVHHGFILHVAASESTLEVVQFLVSQWPASVRQSRQGELPLHRALYTHSWMMPRLDIATFLVDQWKESILIQNMAGKLPLHIAMDNSHRSTRVIRYLAEQCPESLKISPKGFKRNRQALHAAVIKPHSLEVVSILTEVWPDSVKQADSDGNLPLHWAALYSRPLETVQALVQQWPESAMKVNKNGDLPLHLSLRGQYITLDVVACLVAQYPDCTTKKNGAGFVPVQLAIRERFDETEQREAVLCELIDQRSPLSFICQYYEYLTWNVFEKVLKDQPGLVVQNDDNGYLPWQFASLCSDDVPLSVLYRLLRVCPDTI